MTKFITPRWTATGILLCLGAHSMNAYAIEPITLSIDVNADMDDVWHAWSSNDGAQAFFAPATQIEARPDGHFEIYFFPDNEPGFRGAEGTRVLIAEPQKRIAFTWDAPPKWPAIRSQRTVVEVRLESLTGDTTRVFLQHSLWGESMEWAEVREYFVGGWQVVLKRLQWRFDHGPVDWENPAPGLMYQPE